NRRQRQCPRQCGVRTQNPRSWVAGRRNRPRRPVHVPSVEVRLPPGESAGEVDERELNPLITPASSWRSADDAGPRETGRVSRYRLQSWLDANSVGRRFPSSATGVEAVARIAGVNIPTNKRVIIALQYIHGIGAKKASEIMEKVGIPSERRVSQLTDQEVLQIREVIDRDYMVEGDLRREVAMNIKRLMDLGCYRGLRHRRGLPVRGQRTHTNARTRKGPAKAIA